MHTSNEWLLLSLPLVALENCRFGVSIVVAAADIENMAIRRHQWPDRNEKRAKKEQTKQQTLIHMKMFVTNPSMTSVEWIHFGLLSLVSESELRHFLFAAHCYELIEQWRRLIYANMTIIIICWHYVGHCYRVNGAIDMPTIWVHCKCQLPIAMHLLRCTARPMTTIVCVSS